MDSCRGEQKVHVQRGWGLIGWHILPSALSPRTAPPGDPACSSPGYDPAGKKEEAHFLVLVCLEEKYSHCLTVWTPGPARSTVPGISWCRLTYLCPNCLTAPQHSNLPSPCSTTFKNLCKYPSARVRTEKKAGMTASFRLQKPQRAAGDSDWNSAWGL